MYLPDTQIILWFLAEPHNLADTIIAELNAASPAPLFSAVCLWEIAIK